MIVDKFETPVGYFRVFKNSKSISFNIDKARYNSYWIDEETKITTDTCYEIKIDLLDFAEGDTILCELERGELHSDGGGEKLYNIVGVIDNYTIGIAAPDTDDIEYGYSKDELPENMNRTKFYLPYDNIGWTRRGFEFVVKDNPLEYRDRIFRKHIELILVWESNEKSYAWDIVSYMTV